MIVKFLNHKKRNYNYTIMASAAFLMMISSLVLLLLVQALKRAPDLPQTIYFEVGSTEIMPYYNYAHYGDRIEFRWKNNSHNIIILDDQTTVRDVTLFRSGELRPDSSFYLYPRVNNSFLPAKSANYRQLVFASEGLPLLKSGLYPRSYLNLGAPYYSAAITTKYKQILLFECCILTATYILFG